MKARSKVKKGKIYVVMGVSGSGKSTVAPMLADALSLPFFDGDDFHPASNVAKMSAKVPLTDEDRHEWLVRLNDLARANAERGAVLVCSALKESHRAKLSRGLEGRMIWVFLNGPYDLILSRLQERKGHFMPSSLLKSQFETLEAPVHAIHVSIEASPGEIVDEILRKIREGS